MCRGANGAHVRLMPGVTYCAAGRRLHIKLNEVTRVFRIDPARGVADACAITLEMWDFVAKAYPHLPIAAVALDGILPEEGGSDACKA